MLIHVGSICSLYPYFLSLQMLVNSVFSGLLFQQYLISQDKFQFFSHFTMSPTNTFNVIDFRYPLTHSHTMIPFDAPGKQGFRKHCGKRINCSLRAISLFPTVFSTYLDNFLPFSSNLKLSSAKSFSLEMSKICRLVMG